MMHLIFERSKGKFKSNCNILALAWMPYYEEIKFRTALFDYHQRQLINLTSSIAANGSLQSYNGTTNNRCTGPLGRSQQHARAHSTSREHSSNVHLCNEASNQRLNQSVESNSLDGSQHTNQYLNSRVAELVQRYMLLKGSQADCLLSGIDNDGGAAMTIELDAKYGRQPKFGWLVVGNVGKIVGVTLTSVVQPIYSNEKLKAKEHETGRSNKDEEPREDLMQFDENDHNSSCDIDVADKQEPKQSNDNPIVMESNNDRPDKESVRTNYNLRGHLDEVILVKWNELYQKLATIDSKGNVLIWCKINDKFTIQTPFYNRTKSVADFKWSNDGKTALICYTDSFILVGSSSGQRHWHSMLNLDDYHITCASWSPNDDQLLLGVSNGNVVVIDLPHSELTELVVNQANIRTMCWSSCDLTLKGLSKLCTNPQVNCSSNNRLARRTSTTVVNHRRLSRDCSIFSRYRFCSQGPNSVPNRRPASRNEISSNNSDNTFNSRSISDNAKQRNLLAIDFANSTIKLYDGGLDDPDPKTIVVNQESYIMNWSSDGEILAVAGFNIHTTAPSVGCLRCRYLNSIKFYNKQGDLIYQHAMKYTRYPITAFTWAHEDTRLFVATGPRLHCAKVYIGIPSLSLLALSCLQKFTKMPEKGEMFRNVSENNLKSVNLISWQSANCPIVLQSKHTKINSPKSAIPLVRSCDSLVAPHNCNNSNTYMYQLPFKLQTKVDELFSRTIRQPYDENWSLNDIIWHVPQGEQRYYCTLVCYSSERELSSTGHQYRTNLVNSAFGDSQVNDQNKIFVLYIEFLGSLIPILRARRVGFLKPEFVIFDPESREVKSKKQRKISDSSRYSSLDTTMQQRSNNSDLMNYELARQFQPSNFASPQTSAQSFYYNEGANDNCADLHLFSEFSNSFNNSFARMSDAENYYYYSDRGSRTRNLVDGRSYHQEPIALPMDNNPYTISTSTLVNQFPSQNCPTVNANSRTMLHASSNLAHSSARRASSVRHRLKKTGLRYNLPEVDELVRVKSNIWGTKFKLINVKNRMLKQRILLGSLVYKASLLHLQPRQIFLGIKDMSNFCCLCSIHHHSKGNMPVQLNTPGKTSSIKSNTFLDSSTPQPKTKVNQILKRDDKNQVIVPVGDSIRIVPKLDHNQMYKLQERGRLSTSNQISKERFNSLLAEKRPKTSQNETRDNSLSKSNSTSYTSTSNDSSILAQTQYPIEIRNSSKNFQQSSSCMEKPRVPRVDSSSIEVDDILTLSLVQENQVKVEMSSQELKHDNDSKKVLRDQDNNDLDEFLAINKTLKSIQTITRMIVDLSSKANETEAEDARDDPNFSSPCKLVKLSEDSRVSPLNASEYVAPNTPIHKPRHPSKILRNPNSCFQTQSATTTPLKWIADHKNKTPDTHLPPPPPPISISRRFSSSAKRFLDGSLRSLGNNSADDFEQEDSQPLVPVALSMRVPSFLSAQESHEQMKQPRFRNKLLGNKQMSDSSSLKTNLVDKLRSSRSQSKVARKNFMERMYRMNETKRGASLDALHSSPPVSPKSSTSLFSSFEGQESLDPKSRNSDSEAESILKLKIKSFSNSSKNLTNSNQHSASESSSRRSRNKRKSICSNHKCPCNREFKLNNRPPVWNELSQVYQLDFGGRVTQESAKNLQIDFEGKLALQFGRIDRCTYTLDYKYPFNAVQAMAVALASLTQRLK